MSVNFLLFDIPLLLLEVFLISNIHYILVQIFNTPKQFRNNISNCSNCIHASNQTKPTVCRCSNINCKLLFSSWSSLCWTKVKNFSWCLHIVFVCVLSVVIIHHLMSKSVQFNVLIRIILVYESNSIYVKQYITFYYTLCIHYDTEIQENMFGQQCF